MTTPKTMKAITWEGKPFQMSLKDHPVPELKHPSDALIKLTTTAICGTDLHTYRGLAGSKDPPWIMGHEGIGTVTQVNPGVRTLKVGDKVVVGPISCGYCENCVRQRWTYCLTFHPETLVDLPGLGEEFGAGLGGAQAEFIRDIDYIMLSDIFPTAWDGLSGSGFEPGDSVAVFGAGPVGLLCVYSAILRGASKVYSIDYVPSRLEKAKSIGAVPINFKDSDPVQQILTLEPPRYPNGTDAGVRRACDCVGFETLNAQLQYEPGIVIRNCVNITQPTGGIGIIGEYLPAGFGPTPGAPLATGKEGVFEVPLGSLWSKNLSVRGGVVQVKELQFLLKGLIDRGVARPRVVVDEVLYGLDGVAGAYERFEKRVVGKIVVRLGHGEQ
ncbi:GroES-like protein [Aspergillus ruber CBS 135680]|uniref:GroES-like protein n=1 Tax=Aspergillus ruber (strain CBS 135680) TaxID=1388766 RepID=A0A017S4U9_ASPRC|nr:GroES-like protein [Aspergillus ruber CBS 135680]EYE91972.1 GroES-like protein [Aspergillus ruber CBS 135680]